jgi:hypothetical protein
MGRNGQNTAFRRAGLFYHGPCFSLALPLARTEFLFLKEEGSMFLRNNGFYPQTTRRRSSEDHTAKLCGKIFSSDLHVDLELCPICSEN